MFSLGKIEEIVAKSLGIRPDRRAAFSAKVKYYRRMGFPRLPTPGKGNAVDFEPNAIVQLLVVFRLEQHGFAPKQAMLGAIKVNEAVGGKADLPANPYLSFDGTRFSVISHAQAHAILDRNSSATFISLRELMHYLKQGLEDSSKASDDAGTLMDLALYVLENRDGD